MLWAINFSSLKIFVKAIMCIQLFVMTAGDEADDAELLAAALKEDDEPEDNSVTAI